MHADDLNSAVEFNCPFTVDEHGNVSDAHDAYAPGWVTINPDLSLDGLEDWQAVTGFTGQWGYHGPVMHPSEQLAGSMAQHVLDTPGLYAVVEVMGADDDGEVGDDYPAGWALLTKQLP